MSVRNQMRPVKTSLRHLDKQYISYPSTQSVTDFPTFVHMFIIVNTSTDAIVHTLFRTSNYKFYSAKFFGTYTQPCSQTRYAQPTRRKKTCRRRRLYHAGFTPYHLIFLGVGWCCSYAYTWSTLPSY